MLYVWRHHSSKFFVWSLLSISLIRRVSATHAGTAEPMGVSPPEAVAYQVLVTIVSETTISEREMY